MVRKNESKSNCFNIYNYIITQCTIVFFYGITTTDATVDKNNYCDSSYPDICIQSPPPNT